jgi:hypothetical protein
MYWNVVSHEVYIRFFGFISKERGDSQAFLTSTHCQVPNSYDGCPFVAVLSISILKGPRTSVPVQRFVVHFLSYCVVTIKPARMQNIHITRSSERAEQAENVLRQAMDLLEQHRDAVGSDSYNTARGWLTR